MSTLPPSTREPGRRGKQGETRARLVAATIELVRSEGLTGLTTGRIAAAAGIAQPGFYAHFRNVEECLRTAVSEVVEDMRERQEAVRRRAFARVGERPWANDPATIRASYEGTLEVMLGDPRFAELFLRYRRDPALLDGYMQRVMDRVRETLVADLWSLVQKLGFRPEHRAEVAFWAEQLLAMYLAAAEALLDGRTTDRRMVLDALTRSSDAILQANLRFAGLTPEPK